MALELRPVTFKEAVAFIAQHHRHNAPPRFWKFGVSVVDGDRMVGVAVANRPIARHFDDGWTLEVNRTCTDGTRNANSMLYASVWRIAKAMGYRRLITYTQADESGASLKAAGFVSVKKLKPRPSWADATADPKWKSKRDPVGNGGVERELWEIRASQPVTIE